MTVTLCLALASCALTPTELRDQGLQARHESKLSPAQAAACIGRAAEEWRSDQSARWREGSQPGHYEVMFEGRLFQADVAPRGAGSTITVYAHYGVFAGVRDSLIAAMFKGC
jgi:hypothetical protein